MTNEIVKYESAFGDVAITAEDVKKYLVRGNSEVTDKEIKLFMELCKYQKLNPFVGEAYAIKFGQDFQMVIGYETYKRRAEENPTYSGRKSGIVVVRGGDASMQNGKIIANGGEIVQKEGTCLYPGEVLIGGWCRVFRDKNGRIDETYKEVGLDEYDKGQANWKTKPCTMIEKVAVSQALRAAFPSDYAGLYSEVETASDGRIIADNDVIDVYDNEDIVVDEPITQEQRIQLFSLAQENFGKDAGNELVLKLLADEGLKSTTGMLTSVFERIMQRLHDELSKGESFLPSQEKKSVEQA